MRIATGALRSRNDMIFAWGAVGLLVARRGRGSSPHNRRKGYPCMNGQHKRGARRGIRRRDHAKARREICMLRYAGQKVTDAVGTSAAERIPKPLVLAAFFGYFLSLVTESIPPEAFDNRCCGRRDTWVPSYIIWFCRAGPACPAVRVRRSKKARPEWAALSVLYMQFDFPAQPPPEPLHRAGEQIPLKPVHAEQPHAGAV